MASYCLGFVWLLIRDHALLESNTCLFLACQCSGLVGTFSKCECYFLNCSLLIKCKDFSVPSSDRDSAFIGGPEQGFCLLGCLLVELRLRLCNCILRSSNWCSAYRFITQTRPKIDIKPSFWATLAQLVPSMYLISCAWKDLNVAPNFSFLGCSHR